MELRRRMARIYSDARILFGEEINEESMPSFSNAFCLARGYESPSFRKKAIFFLNSSLSSFNARAFFFKSSVSSLSAPKAMYEHIPLSSSSLTAAEAKNSAPAEAKTHGSSITKDAPFFKAERVRAYLFIMAVSPR